jgi:hypothetical protein
VPPGGRDLGAELRSYRAVIEDREYTVTDTHVWSKLFRKNSLGLWIEQAYKEANLASHRGKQRRSLPSSGHISVFEEDTEILGFSPKTEYQKTVEIVARNMAALETME